jgi:predicted chitinase
VLLAKFGYYKRHHDEAKTDGRAENSKIALTTDQQRVIANKVYGGQHGFDDLGNLLKQPNDGWNFRGRGMKQTTGRFNYGEFKNRHKELWGEDVDFIAHPDKVSEMPYAIRSAVVFWVYKHCWQAADGGMNDSAIDAVTHIVNSGELAAYNKHPTTDSPILNRRKFVKLAYAAFS